MARRKRSSPINKAREGSKSSSRADRLKAILDKIDTMDLSSGGGFWKVPEGRTTIRVLPPVGTMEFFFQETGQHYEQNIACPAKTNGGDCPLCEINQELWRAGNKEAASKFRPTDRYRVNIIIRGDEDAGVLIWTAPKTVFQAMVELLEDDEYGLFYDEDDGFDLKITRKGKMKKTEYGVSAARDNSTLSDDDDEIDEWLESANDLTKYTVEGLSSYDDIIKQTKTEAFFDGYEAEDDEEDEEGLDEIMGEEEEDEKPSQKIGKMLKARDSRKRSAGRGRRSEWR